MATKAQLKAWAERMEADLQQVVRFWMQHSLDRECGGYFNNLDRDGTCYDTNKQMWLQGRQVGACGRIRSGDARGPPSRRQDSFLLSHGRCCDCI